MLDLIAKELFLTKGKGVHEDRLTSFEYALRDAGIAGTNLVLISSIFPPKAKLITRKEGLKKIKAGQILFTIYSKNQTKEPHRVCSASVGIAQPKDTERYGYLSEYEAFGQNENQAGDYAEDIAAQMLASSLGINNSFFMTSDDHEKLIIRPKSNYDLSLPSGNSVSSFVMLRLYHLSQEQSFLDIAIKIMESQAQIAAENPFGFGYLLNTLSLYLEKPVEITIINSENSEICKSLFTNYLPNSFMVTIQNPDQLKNLSEYPFFTGKSFEDNTSVFICKNFSCSLPLHTLDEVNSKL